MELILDVVLYLSRKKILRDIKKHLRKLPPDIPIDISAIQGDTVARFLVAPLDLAVAVAIQQFTGIEIVGELPKGGSVEYNTQSLWDVLFDTEDKLQYTATDRTLWRPRKPQQSETILAQLPAEIGRQATLDYIEVRAGSVNMHRFFPDNTPLNNAAKITEVEKEESVLEKVTDFYFRTYADTEALVDRF